VSELSEKHHQLLITATTRRLIWRSMNLSSSTCAYAAGVQVNAAWELTVVASSGPIARPLPRMLSNFSFVLWMLNE
jgi:hypothetical protein